MRLTPHEQDKNHAKAIIAILLVTLLSIIGAVWASMTAREHLRTNLSERSQSIATALGAHEIAKLKGQPSDETTPAYKNLKVTLARIKQVNPDIRSLYIMGERDGQLFFFVDSETPGSDDYSPAGQKYDDGTPEDYALFQNGKPLVEGPVKDSYGTFISGLAPVATPENNGVLAAVGIDVEAAITRWR
jgi:hypothetical protein